MPVITVPMRGGSWLYEPLEYWFRLKKVDQDAGCAVYSAANACSAIFSLLVTYLSMLPQISKQPIVPTPDHLGLSAPDTGETEAGVFPPL